MPDSLPASSSRASARARRALEGRLAHAALRRRRGRPGRLARDQPLAPALLGREGPHRQGEPGQERRRPQGPDRLLARAQPPTALQAQPPAQRSCPGKLQLLSCRLTARTRIEKPGQLLSEMVRRTSAEREMSVPRKRRRKELTSPSRSKRRRYSGLAPRECPQYCLGAAAVVQNALRGQGSTSELQRSPRRNRTGAAPVAHGRVRGRRECRAARRSDRFRGCRVPASGAALNAGLSAVASLGREPGSQRTQASFRPRWPPGLRRSRSELIR